MTSHSRSGMEHAEGVAEPTARRVTFRAIAHQPCNMGQRGAIRKNRQASSEGGSAPLRGVPVDGGPPAELLIPLNWSADTSRAEVAGITED